MTNKKIMCKEASLVKCAAIELLSLYFDVEIELKRDEQIIHLLYRDNTFKKVK